MKGWMIAASALLLAGCSGGNVYDMPVGEAYAKLANLRVLPSNDGPFGRLNTTTTGSGRTVTWSASGSMASRRCVATLSPVEPARTRIDLTCNGGGAGSGAAAGLETNQTRKAVIEMIDAKLTDRPYDPRRAQGSTAAFWPDDVVDHGDIGTASANALEMEREMREASRSGH
jgi:hypothetical protein